MQFALATAGLAPLLNAGSAPHLGPRQEAGVGSRRRFEADEEIYAEGDRAAHFYKVVSGAVRTYKLLDDGRRQIAGFHLPGDIFGVEAGEEHRFGAEAVTETTLAVHRRSDRAMMGALDRAQEHMILLGRKSAKERIASFLLGLAERTRSATAVELPMSRGDIADHLGLTVESVSRSLTQLERAGIIELPTNRRMVVLRDKATLRRLDA
jgi:CRP/FNR family transcriptional regulator, nitrogen fixation regulation protein